MSAGISTTEQPDNLDILAEAAVISKMEGLKEPKEKGYFECETLEPQPDKVDLIIISESDESDDEEDRNINDMIDLYLDSDFANNN